MAEQQAEGFPQDQEFRNIRQTPADELAEAVAPEPGWNYGTILPLRSRPSANGLLGREFEPTVPLGVRDILVDLMKLAQRTHQENAGVAPGENLPIGEVLSLASIMSGAGGLNPSPRGSLGMFAGSSAKTAPKINRAAELVAGGATPKEVWQKTGWFLDKDGNWKWEIPDAKARLLGIDPVQMSPNQLLAVQPGGTTLPKLLEHPELYDAYPQLRATRVLPDDGPRGSGWMNPDTGNLHVAPGNYAETMRTLLHETQHKVQGIEGFAKGGAPEEFLPKDFQRNWESNDAMLRTLQSMLPETDLGKAYQGYKALVQGGLPQPSEKAALDAVKNDQIFGQHTLSAFERQHALDNDYRQAYDKYRSLAGEVESSNVEERWAGNDYASHPHETMGYPQEQQLLRYRLTQKPSYKLVPVPHNPFEEPR